MNDVKTRNGTFYFPTHETARDYAVRVGAPTDRIIHYTAGYAIQWHKSGPYVGPSDLTHTPGPWHVGNTLSAAGDDLRMIKDSRTTIAYTTRPTGDETAERDANARLIAAAPELHAALEAADIALTNTLQLFEDRTLGASARAKVQITRDRIRAALERVDGTGE